MTFIPTSYYHDSTRARELSKALPLKMTKLKDMSGSAHV